MKELNLEWTSADNQHCFAYYMTIIKENRRYIYADAIGYIYKLAKKTRMVYINDRPQGVATNVFIITR